MKIAQLARRLFVAAITLSYCEAAEPPAGMGPTKPIVIAHRGASGYRPEHTLEAYKLAIEQGADFIEPDLVATKDGHLICRHDVLLDDTTNVAELAQFADRKSTKPVDARQVTGWFACDFTLEEIKQLGARTRRVKTHLGIKPDRPNLVKFDDQFKVATFDEVCELAKKRGVGIYPELKQPAFHKASTDLNLVDLLIAALERHELLAESNVPIFVQCFEARPLVELRNRIGDKSPIKLIRLVTYEKDMTEEAIAKIAEYADGIGPNVAFIRQVKDDGKGGSVENVVSPGVCDRAKAYGLLVHVWTLRADEPNVGMPIQKRMTHSPGIMTYDVRRLMDAGVDGIFADQPDVARRAVDEWWAEQQTKLRPK